MAKPYVNLEENDEFIIREFDQNIDPSELVWHRDKENRLVIPMEDNDWMVQLDNELPRPLNEEVFIPAEAIHRVIKGTGKLRVKIMKS